MPALLLALAILAADRWEAALFAAVNEARTANGVAALAPNAALGEAADIEASWLVYAQRRRLPWSYHLTDTQWLASERPDLDWYKLFATYGGDLPGQLGIYDVSRLCGYGGLAKDNIGRANKTAATAVAGWLRSKDGHRENMLDPAWTELGTARVGGGQDAICVAVFGNQE